MFSFLNFRLLSVCCLGFASGIPLGLISSTLQAWYTVSGISLLTIGWLSLVGQPYAFKFLWAPLLDQFSLSAALGRRRSWIALMQLLLASGFFILAFMNPVKTPYAIVGLVCLIAIFSATQDTAIDAYRTEILSETERGLGVSLTTIAYRTALIVSTAFALIIAAKFGWKILFILMAFLFILLGAITIFAPDPLIQQHASFNWRNTLLAPCKEFLARPYSIIILIFIVNYKLSDAMALALNTTFLIRGIGFTLIQVGAISKIIGLTASLAGTFVGGLLVTRIGLYRALMNFGLLQTLSNGLYVWLAYAGKNMVIMSIALFGEYFCGGLATVAFIVFLMQLCDRRYTATHYALFSAVAAIPRIFIGPLSADIVAHIGWIDFYWLSMLIGLPALFILWCLSSIALDGIQQIKSVA